MRTAASDATSSGSDVATATSDVPTAVSPIAASVAMPWAEIATIGAATTTPAAASPKRRSEERSPAPLVAAEAPPGRSHRLPADLRPGRRPRLARARLRRTHTTAVT